MHFRTERPKRQAVLIVAGHGMVRAFAERNVDVRIVRIPETGCREGEAMAEDVVEMSLPKRYRDLYFADKQQAVESSRPLAATSALDASRMSNALAYLDRSTDPKRLAELQPAGSSAAKLNRRASA